MKSHFFFAEFFPLDEQMKEIFSAWLTGFEIEGVEELPESMKVYYKPHNFHPKQFLELIKQNRGFENIRFTQEILEEKNWNAVWEAGFKPVVISDKVRVRASFHERNEKIPIEILIDPKMAFGTGHHESTQLMMEMMQEMDFSGKTVLDFGCGTGILSILAKKLSAKKISALDIDELATENMCENVKLNDCADIEILTGGAEVIPDVIFNIILANVNKNIILENLKILSSKVEKGGIVLFSGLLLNDESAVVNAAAALQLKFLEKKTKNEWLCLKLCKL